MVIKLQWMKGTKNNLTNILSRFDDNKLITLVL